ncbi:MAG: hypothetical protein PUC36_00520 [Clostridiales bacterium]|nr:hypothetical protein [Clostridiales bacterium]
MKSGVYQYSLKMIAPIGPRYGRLELHLLSGSGKGFLTMFSKRLPITEVHCCDETLRFSGIVEPLLYQLPYTAEGTVSSQAIQKKKP